MIIAKIELHCGLTTCAREPGKFCNYFGSIKFGTVPVCRLFPSEGESYTELEEKEGWTQRCDACLVACRTY